ncbi:MAG: hypothetical protein ACRYGI_11575 [Janthinobacterium lividum]
MTPASTSADQAGVGLRERAQRVAFRLLAGDKVGAGDGDTYVARTPSSAQLTLALVAFAMSEAALATPPTAAETVGAGVWKPHLDYAGEPMEPGEYRDPETAIAAGAEAMREAAAKVVEADLDLNHDGTDGTGYQQRNFVIRKQAAAIRALPLPAHSADHARPGREVALREGEWFYPEGDHSSDESRFSPDEVIDYALEGESVSRVVCIERAASLPSVYAAVRVWTDAEKDARQSDDDYDYTLFATHEEAQAALLASPTDADAGEEK